MEQYKKLKAIGFVWEKKQERKEAGEVEGKPKRRAPRNNGYIRFSKQMYPKVLEENPNLAFEEVGMELGVRWRALSDAEKARYKIESPGP